LPGPASFHRLVDRLKMVFIGLAGIFVFAPEDGAR
jgi:hypothetical protein